MSDKSREYQENSINEIRENFRQGYKQVLLWLATGGGKTFIFCRMVKQAVERGNDCMIVVRGRKLVDQASERLFREGVAHGVMMAKHWNYRPNAKVQVCSIDTLLARNIRPKAQLIIIDEAHLFDPDSEATKLIQSYGDVFTVSVTATPYLPKGLGHLAKKIVHPITMLDLMDAGFLTRFRYFAPAAPNLEGVKISSSTKDYVSDQLADVMSESSLTGNIVSHWREYAKGRPTICFCVNVQHSKMMAEKFRNEGISAEHVDADSTDDERKAVIERSKSGETEVICNVGILCTGVDMPWIRAVISARPTTSINLFIQQCGRGTRPVYADGFDLSSAEGRLAAIAAGPKTDCILLDHAGNTEKWLPTDELDVDLEGVISEDKPTKSRRCKQCFAVYRGSATCPECGWKPTPAEEAAFIAIEESNGKLRELTDIEMDPVKRVFKKLEKERKLNGKKPGWTYHRMINKFGLEKSREYLPQYFIDRYEGTAFENSDSIYRFSKPR